MERKIYVDHSATTYTDESVLSEMLPYFTTKFGNASSIYSLGQEAYIAVDKSRDQVAKYLNANKDEIYFVSGGSEANNLIIKGIAKSYVNKGNHIITSSIEHPAVLNTCHQLEKEGFNVTYLKVDKNGLVSMEDLENAITDKTILISIMFANNEIGTIQDIKAIGKLAAKYNVFFHTDAVQAIGTEIIDVKEMNISALSLSAHKFYGPKGVGAAYIKSGIKFEALINGGHQERSKRAGTENVPGVVGMGKAIELSSINREEYVKHVKALRDKYVEEVLRRIPKVIYNGDKDKRLPGNANISIQGIEGEALLLLLNNAGICASSGSACTSGSLDPSHVLLAIGLPHEIAHGSLRTTFGKCNTMGDVIYIVDNLEKIVNRLRLMSPLWKG